MQATLIAQTHIHAQVLTLAFMYFALCIKVLNEASMNENGAIRCCFRSFFKLLTHIHAPFVVRRLGFCSARCITIKYNILKILQIWFNCINKVPKYYFIQECHECSNQVRRGDSNSFRGHLTCLVQYPWRIRSLKTITLNRSFLYI